MVFTETPLRGAWLIDLERQEDDRGYFARVYCHREFAERGLDPSVAQASVAFNRTKGIVRGLHLQYPPSAEAKLVRCVRGALFDVIVDLRPESKTYLQHFTVELSAENGRQIYVPERFAHGYQALEDATEVSYLMNVSYTPEAEGGLPHDDPRLGIAWPLPVIGLSPRDRRWAPLDRIEPELRARMMDSAAVRAR